LVKPLIYTAAIDIIAEDRSEGFSTYIWMVVALNLWMNISSDWFWMFRGFTLTLKVHKARYGIKHVLY